MYNNLNQGLKIKGLSSEDLAKLLDVSSKTARNKINGITQFTLPEANKIMSFIFPEYSMDYIFKEVKQPKKVS